MALTRSDKTEVQRAMAKHLMKNGASGWAEVRLAFPGVPSATFWRWVKQIKVQPTLLQRQAARILLSTVPGAAIPDDAALPAPVSMLAVAKSGQGVVKQIHFILEVQQLMSDAKLLRAFAMSPDRGEIRDPKVFTDATKLGLQLLHLWLAALPEIYSAERTQQLFTAVLEAVSSCDPAISHQIAQKLRALSEEAGYVVQGSDNSLHR